MIERNMDPRTEAEISRPAMSRKGFVHQERSPELAGTWTLTGQWQPVGESVPVRCTTVFRDDGTITSKWEYASDDSDAQPSRVVESIKSRSRKP